MSVSHPRVRIPSFRTVVNGWQVIGVDVGVGNVDLHLLRVGECDVGKSSLIFPQTYGEIF